MNSAKDYSVGHLLLKDLGGTRTGGNEMNSGKRRIRLRLRKRKRGQSWEDDEREKGKNGAM